MLAIHLYNNYVFFRIRVFIEKCPVWSNDNFPQQPGDPHHDARKTLRPPTFARSRPPSLQFCVLCCKIVNLRGPGQILRFAAPTTCTRRAVWVAYRSPWSRPSELFIEKCANLAVACLLLGPINTFCISEPGASWPAGCAYFSSLEAPGKLDVRVSRIWGKVRESTRRYEKV